MTKIHQIYKCEICGNIIEVLHPGAPALVCCEQPMKHLPGNTTDAATEKHVPVIEKTPAGIKVSVGSVLHPMEEKHYIEWIEVISPDSSCIHFLKPGDAPVAEFKMDISGAVTVREHCNIHGLWKTEG